MKKLALVCNIIFFLFFLSNNFHIYADLNFVIFTSCQKSLASCLKQEYPSFAIMHLQTDDGDSYLESLKDDKNYSCIKFFTEDKRLGVPGTIWRHLHEISDEAIVIILQENEEFINSTVLSELEKYYKDTACWMTIGALIDKENQELSFDEASLMVQQGACREHRLSCKKPISFYNRFFKQIKLQDLLASSQSFYRSHYAYTYPLLEMACNHIVYVQEPFITATSCNDESIQEQEELQKKRCYKKLVELDKAIKKEKCADFVIFSYDRPLQLYALLESIERYVQGVGAINIVFRTSSSEIEKAYKKVKKRFPSVCFIQQSKDDAYRDFKEKTIQAFCAGTSDYVFFAVDDIIVKDYINVAECIYYMQMTHAHGFYLRLGKNITYCYMNKRNQKVPELLAIDKIGVWFFNKAESDWGYPNTVDMTLYAKKEVLPLLKDLSYFSPNILEGQWANNATKNNDMEKVGLCFEQSNIINIPLNQVQSHSGVRLSMNIPTKDLLKEFKKGHKIDVKPFFRIKNNSPHMEYMPTFIKR